MSVSFSHMSAMGNPPKFSWIVAGIAVMFLVWFTSKLVQARRRFRKLRDQGIPIMTHSLLLGHLLIVRQFYQDWASDANFIQTFGYYMVRHWKKFFPDEERCPPLIYVDVWPISRPMAFSMEAYVSNQLELRSNLPKSPMQGEFLRPISDGKDLNCMHGEEWRTWRSRFNPGFSQTNIRTWIPALLQDVEAFADVLRSLAGKIDGDWGEVFQLEKIAGDLAFDAIGRVVLDTSLGSQSRSPSPFTVAYREQLQRMEISLSPLKLLWRMTPIFKLRVNRKREQLFQLLRPFIVDNLGVVQSGSRTIVQCAVEEFNRETATKGALMTEKVDESFIELVFCQLMIFFFGGDDAISITIPQIFRQLQLNPECLAKLRAEHDRVLGPDPSIASSKIKEAPHLLDSLSYTLAVIKETLRLNPATITIREGQPSFSFRIKGSDVPWPTDGFDVFDSSITIHRDPANFPKPLEFIPERFLVPEGDALHPEKNVWRAFQLGPRKCIGQEMAIVVLKLMLVLVVRNFDIEMAWEEWDRMREQQGLKVQRTVVEGERMYTAGKATSHPKDGAPSHVRVRCASLG